MRVRGGMEDVGGCGEESKEKGKRNGKGKKRGKAEKENERGRKIIR